MKKPLAEFKPDNLTIVCHVQPGCDYEIDLEELTESAKVLDFIFQIAGKKWGTVEMIKDLISAFETASRTVFKMDAQGAMCPFGKSMRMDWFERKSKPLLGDERVGGCVRSLPESIRLKIAVMFDYKGNLQVVWRETPTFKDKVEVEVTWRNVCEEIVDHYVLTHIEGTFGLWD